MKIKITLLATLFVLLTFNSCELFKELDDLGEVDIYSDFKIDYPVEVDQEDQNISLMETFDITEDEEVKKYKDHLESITVDSVMLGIVSLTGEDVVFNGDLKYSKASENSGTSFVTITDLNISELYTNQSLAKLPVELDKIGDITSILENDMKIKVYLIGTVSTAPVTCEISIYFYTTITAQAI